MSRRGFSLVEVMLATAILGMAAVSMLLVIVECSRRGTDADELRRAAMRAGALMDELVAGQADRARGEIAEDGLRYVYARRIEPWKAGEGEPVEMRAHTLQMRTAGGLELELVRFTAPPPEPPEEPAETPEAPR